MKKLLIIAGLMLLVIMATGCQQTAVTSAKVYMQQSNYDKAIEQCKLAIQEIPNNPEAYFIMGEAYSAKRMYREMNEAFKKSLESSKKFELDIERTRDKNWRDLFNGGVGYVKQQIEAGVATEEEAKMLMKFTPLGRRAEPEELAPMFVYLASDESGFVAASNFMVDGGSI